MSGHSKWSTIKRKKGATDARRGKLFTKLIKEVTVAARSGGDEESNPRLRTAVVNARSANMPQATVERAIRRGTGEEPGAVYEEGSYEGYGPGGVAILVETLTDNKNRTVSDVRHVFAKHGGNLAEKGAVSWMMAVMDAGAEDIQDTGEVFEVLTPLESFEAVKQALDDTGIPFGQASLAWIPQNYLEVVGAEADKIIRLLEGLEDLDDVQRVFSNFDILEEELQRLIA